MTLRPDPPSVTYPAPRPRFFFNIPSAPFVARRRLQHRSLKQRPSGRQWWAAGHVSENIDGTRHVVGPSGAVLMSWAPWVQPLAGAAPSCVVDMRSLRPASRPTCAAAIQISCRGRLDDIAKGWEPNEVLTIGRARTGTGRSRRSRTQFGGSSGCYCHHAHLAQARTGRGGYGIGKEPKSRSLWSALRQFRIFPFGAQVTGAGQFETRVGSRSP